jgi:hypothetical protein
MRAVAAVRCRGASDATHDRKTVARCPDRRIDAPLHRRSPFSGADCTTPIGAKRASEFVTYSHTKCARSAPPCGARRPIIAPLPGSVTVHERRSGEAGRVSSWPTISLGRSRPNLAAINPRAHRSRASRQQMCWIRRSMRQPSAVRTI